MLTLTEIVLIVIAGTVVMLGITAGALTIKHRHKPEDAPASRFNRDLQDAPLPSGVYMIIGPQGVGKTSLMMAIMSEDYRYHGAERLVKARAEVAKMQAVDASYNSLSVPPCAYRSRTKLMLPNGKPTYHIDISQFGLPEGQADVQYLPCSTFVACDEIDSYMDSRRWQEDKQYIIDGLKYIRHNDLVLMADAQSFDKVDIAIRRLTTDIFYVTDKRDIYDKPKWWARFFPRADKRKIIATEWHFLHIKQQLMDNAQRLKQLGIDTPVSSYYRKCKFVFTGNIYKQYNSVSGKPYWYNGIKTYEVEQHPYNNLTRAGVEQWCNSNALRFERASKSDKNNNQRSDKDKDGKTDNKKSPE